jgi:acetyl-CoA acetyltransferase
MTEVVVAGCGMTAFGKHANRSVGDLAKEAVAAAFADASLAPSEVGFVAFANVVSGVLSGQNSIRGQVFLDGAGLERAPLVNVENACASGGSAVHLAWLAVASGECDVALAVGSEKMHVEDRPLLAKLMLSGVDVSQLDAIRDRVDPERRNPTDNGFLMDVYAHNARRYMDETGTTRDDLAAVSVKNRAHGFENRRAQFREKVSREQVLESRMVSPPLSLLMCSPLSDGAAAVVLTTEERARATGRRPIRVAATTLRCGAAGREGSAVTDAARAAYTLAGLGPEDVDVIELHDACASAELVAYEQLELCRRGDAAKLLAEGTTTIGGRIPVNPSGGLLTKGHPVGATGCAQVVELCEQLLGRCGARQVEGARTALAMNAGGFVGESDVAACTVTVLRT